MCVSKRLFLINNYTKEVKAMLKQYEKDLYITCEYDGRSRYGFNHIGKIFYKGRLIHVEKIHYINRTWEAYEYQSLLFKCEEWIDNNLKLEHFKKQA